MYYECKKNEKLFNITKFPNLNFEIREIRFNFTFTYEDLFFSHNEYIYFGIIFDKYYKFKYNQGWKLGSALFKKYLLTFNIDKKMIGIYKNTIEKVKNFKRINDSNNKENSRNNNDSNKNNNDSINIMVNYEFIKIIIIICLIILFLFLGIIFKKYINICNKNKNSKKINYKKKSTAYSSKNKKEIHQYFELENNLLENEK